MPVIDREYINELAEHISESLDLSIPVSLEQVVAKLGGELSRQKLPESVDAIIYKMGDAFQIVISEDSKAGNRDRFSIAHELGHLFLHMGYLIDPEKWASTPEYKDSVYLRYGYSEEEFEANEFAAALLMPRSAYAAAVEKYTVAGRCDVAKLADHFQVSKKAALIRGRWLGIFRWQ